MAFYDWNNDGKKDFADDYIEYNIYKESTQNNNYSSGGGISNIGAICGTIITFVASAVIAGAFGLEGIPLVVVFIILCVIIGACIACYFDEIGF